MHSGSPQKRFWPRPNSTAWCFRPGVPGRLAQFASLQEAKADGALHAHHLAFGRVAQRDGIERICIDEGIGYPTTARLAGDDVRH